MGDRMFKKMDYVYNVYNERSFTKAAQKLYISQPCLSAAIKKIEDEIGQPLFERRYSSVKPTKIGLEYIETIEKIMKLENDFREKISEEKSLQYGSIVIGGSNYVSSHILPKIVNKFTELYPKIDISLIEAGSLELEKKLACEEVDIVIDSFDDTEMIFESFPLLNEKILLAVPKVSKCNDTLKEYQILPESIFEETIDYKKVKSISINAFKNEKFILLKNGHNMYKHAQNIFKKENFNPLVRFRLDQLLTSYSLTASGNGVCFVTDTMFRYYNFRDDVILYNVEGSGNRTLYVLKKRNRHTTSAMKMFMQIAKETIKN